MPPTSVYSPHVSDTIRPGRTINDFRLTTRTFYLNSAIVRFWYWHMNYHIEHHMYAAVPCYHLATLHEAIKHDLPPTPNGFVETWRAIGTTLRKQALDPSYQPAVCLPTGGTQSEKLD